MYGRTFAKFVFGFAALLLVCFGALADEFQRGGPVSQAGLETMRSAPGAGDAGLSAPAVTEIRAFSCANPGTGAPIPVIANQALQNIAVSRRLASGELMIYYNPKYIGLFQPATALFWLEHECMHHQLGHTSPEYPPALTDSARAAEENAADCAAIKKMVKRRPPMIDAQGLQTIEAEVAKLTGGGFYKTGPERARWIDGCVIQAVAEIKAEQARQAGQTK